MSGKNNDLDFHENEKDPDPKSAPGTMAVSILLLIAGLWLSSALLINNGLIRKGNPGLQIAPSLEKAKSLFGAEKSKHPPPPAPASSQAETSPPKKKGFMGFSRKKKKEEEKRDVHWPRLKLSGFGKPAAGETGFAIINGKRIDEGSNISGALVVEVLDQGVALEYQGETKILTMEEPTH